MFRSLILLLFYATTLVLTNPIPDKAEVKELSKNVYSFTSNILFKLNSMFIVTECGVIVIEPFNTKHSELMLETIRTITNQPIAYLLISHNHWDHSSGGKVFKDVGAKVLAHQEAIEYMEKYPNPEVVVPDHSWTGKKHTIKLGEATVDLHYFGVNHGHGMTVFVYKQKMKSQEGAVWDKSNNNIAFIADIVSPRAVLYERTPDMNIHELIRTLGEVLQLKFNKAVFTHSELRPNNRADGTKQDVQNAYQYAVDLRAEVHKEFDKGTDLFSNPGAVQLPKYKDLVRYDVFLKDNVLKVMWERVIGPYPWRSVDRFMKASTKKDL